MMMSLCVVRGGGASRRRAGMKQENIIRHKRITSSRISIFVIAFRSGKIEEIIVSMNALF